MRKLSPKTELRKWEAGCCKLVGFFLLFATVTQQIYTALSRSSELSQLAVFPGRNKTQRSTFRNENRSLSTSREHSHAIIATSLIGESIVDGTRQMYKHLMNRKLPGIIAVTAADASHFSTLLGAIASLRRTEMAHTRVVVYDLGLKSCQKNFLSRAASYFSGDVGGNEAAVVVRQFPFRDYPRHFNISDQAGSYAWKPLIIDQTLKTAMPGTTVVWIDAGTEVGRRLSTILSGSTSFVAQGFLSSVTTGTMQQWIHRGMLQWFANQGQKYSDVQNVMKRERFSGKNCNGAFLAIKKGSSAAASIMPSWIECALNKSCIAPEGSSRRNHRQDQAALTVLTKLRLPASSGCRALRSDGTMRFWRDQYYNVNSPIFFSRGSKQSLCEKSSAIELSSALFECAHYSPKKRISEVAVVLMLTLSAKDMHTTDEKRLLATIASVRQYFLSSDEQHRVHIIVVTTASVGRVRLERVEKYVGADSFVSVMASLNRHAIRLLLAQYDHTFLYGCETWNGHLPTIQSNIPASAILDHRNSGLVLFRGINENTEVDSSSCAFLGSMDNTLITEAVLRYLESVSRTLDTFTSMSTIVDLPKETLRCCVENLSTWSDLNTYEPFLVTEAATGEKNSQIRNKQLIKALPSQGITLAILTVSERDRSCLAFACLLMGSLGFGVRWHEGLLYMRELEKFDENIALSAANPEHLSAFAQKSRREVKHAPWLIFSKNLAQTLPVWKAHLGKVVCIVFEDGVQYKKGLKEGCGIEKRHAIHFTAFSDSGFYRLFQDLNSVVGNVRALSREEVRFIVRMRATSKFLSERQTKNNAGVQITRLFR